MVQFYVVIFFKNIFRPLLSRQRLSYLGNIKVLSKASVVFPMFLLVIASKEAKIRSECSNTLTLQFPATRNMWNCFETMRKETHKFLNQHCKHMKLYKNNCGEAKKRAAWKKSVGNNR